MREAILDLILADGVFIVQRLHHDALLGGRRLTEFEMVDRAASGRLVPFGCRHLAFGARSTAWSLGSDAE